jgi:hypothetical protein
MTRVTSGERVREYVQGLTPQVRGRLLDELERLHLAGEDIKGSEALLAELRTEFRGSGQRHERVNNPARYFFQPLEPVLVNRIPERANSGQISRSSLAAIWEWIGQCLLPAMTREYDARMRQIILANNQVESRKVAAAFQAKVAKGLEGALTGDAAERTREQLAKFTTSAGVIIDLTKMRAVLLATDALSRFEAALPREIDTFEREALVHGRDLLNRLASEHAEAVPFALTMIMKRLKAPWQLIRLATDAVKSRKAADIFEAPYAISVSMVLDHLDERRQALHNALTSNSILVARDILVDIHGIEHALRHRIDRLEGTAWGQRLDELMQATATELDVELHKLPDNVHHVLASYMPHQSESPLGRLMSFVSKGHRVLEDGAAYCRDLLAFTHRSAGHDRGRPS